MSHCQRVEPTTERSAHEHLSDGRRKTMIDFLISINSDDPDAMTPKEAQEMFAALWHIEAVRRRGRGAGALKP